MQPRNKPGEPAENYSVAECARFDPKAGRWEALPPLPQPRSSHDVAVIGNQLMVIGGWNMQGLDGNEWLDTIDVLDEMPELLHTLDADPAAKDIGE